MTRHQLLKRTMRSPVRQARRRKNRAHRIARRAWRAEFDEAMEFYRRQQDWIWYERIGMLVHRPQNIAVLTSV